MSRIPILDYLSPPPDSTTPRWRVRLIRFVLVVIGLAAWFFTQWLIGRRAFPENGIGDALLDWLAPAHAYLTAHPGAANALLISSSVGIDFLALYILGYSIFGRSIRPFLGLIVLFGLRQICQGLCALPPPEGMIWRYPGFPSLLVTYGVSNDLFFSGHTALAIYGAIVLARSGGKWLAIAGTLIAIYEVAAVLLLRAHYTMDVFTGALAAILVAVVFRERKIASC